MMTKIMKQVILSCAFLSSDAFAPGFWTLESRRPNESHVKRDAALTPIGPLCPFRSPATDSLEDEMEALSKLGPEISTAVTRVHLELQMSSSPNQATLLEAADSIEQAVDK